MTPQPALRGRVWPGSGRSTSRSRRAEAGARPRLLPRTIFEFQGGTLDSAQNALGGGGRYDGLVEALGGPADPGVGFALGLDRTLLACDDEGVFPAPSTAPMRSSSTSPAGLEASR
jgi:hypothetical protein